MTQHANLSAERWARFNLDQQILMIGNEMSRASSRLGDADPASLLLCYERVLRLVDLTVQVQTRYGLRRELLRWRDLIAELYLQAEPDPAAHVLAFEHLLRMTPVASRQIPFVIA